MGKTEKIVVLSVLFAVVVLFVWSLQGPEARAAAVGEDPTAPTADEPADSANVFQRATPKPRPVIKLAEPTIGGPGSFGQTDAVAIVEGPLHPNEQGLLTSRIVEPEQPEGIQLKAGWDLVSSAGLEPTVDPEMMILRPASGSTWASLAVTLYGDEGRARLLRHYNEGMVVPGEQVLVPAIDDLDPAPAYITVEVLEGESLWLVSERTLGSGARWKEIFDLNRGIISDASKVRAGMMLQVPAAN